MFFFLQESAIFLDLLEKFSDDEYEKLGVQCDMCKTHILDPMELGGNILGRSIMSDLRDFKTALAISSTAHINQFLHFFANDKQIPCARCGGFGKWNLITVGSNQKTPKNA